MKTICYKKDKLTAQILMCEYDVIAITKTSLQDGQVRKLNIPGYTRLKYNRQKKRKLLRNISVQWWVVNIDAVDDDVE